MKSLLKLVFFYKTNNCKADLQVFTVTSTLDCIMQLNVNRTVRLQWDTTAKYKWADFETLHVRGPL
jgi:hypothetical protein